MPFFFFLFYFLGVLQETQKFKAELLKRLSEDVDEFGDDLDAVVDVCAQVNALFFLFYFLRLILIKC